MKVSVVILNWNGKTLLEEYLPNVVAYTLDGRVPEVELVVADNGSTDGSLAFLAAHFPSVRCLDLQSNHGYAEGYNLALEQLDSDCAVLLNSDVRVTEGWLSTLIAYMEAHPEVAAAQPKIRSLREPEYFEHAGASGGYIDALGYPFCRGRLLSWVEKDLGQYDEVADVFWATGACLCVRLPIYKAVGGLDALFFAHMEEIDLCWRLKSRGHRLVCVPESVVYHLGGATLNVQNPRKTFLNYRNNLLMLYKNLPASQLVGVLLLRCVLDYFSAVVFWASGKHGDAKAVCKARVAFWKLRPLLCASRRENQKAATVQRLPQRYAGSLLLAVYAGGKRRFQDLRFKA
jgi:GT2 family glycosyltransferase